MVNERMRKIIIKQTYSQIFGEWALVTVTYANGREKEHNKIKYQSRKTKMARRILCSIQRTMINTESIEHVKPK